MWHPLIGLLQPSQDEAQTIASSLSYKSPGKSPVAVAVAVAGFCFSCTHVIVIGLHLYRSLPKLIKICLRPPQTCP